MRTNRNPIARYMGKFNKPKVIDDRAKIRRKIRSKQTRFIRVGDFYED